MLVQPKKFIKFTRKLKKEYLKLDEEKEEVLEIITLKN